MTNYSRSAKLLCSVTRSLFVGSIFVLLGLFLALPGLVESAAAPPKEAAKTILQKSIAETMAAPVTPLSSSFKYLAPMQAGPLTLQTFATDCTTSKSTYNLNDADRTVCAKFTGALPGWLLVWSNAHAFAVQVNVISSSNGSNSFALSPTSSLGDWRVILFDPLGGGVYAVTPFTVVDSQNPVADLTISKSGLVSETAAGAQAVYSVQATNNGPSSATNVAITDAVPSGTTFVSFVQLSGPVFGCVSPSVGDTGTTTCTISNLAKGETATFLATYLVDNGATVGSTISNTATISSATQDVVVPEFDNNTSAAEIRIASAPCVLTPPDNITVDADAGQPGAMVTYSPPTSTGDCGQPSTGEGGETIPGISCNPPSGSFFPAGTTTVTCVAQTGGAASFQVTVNNPGGLAISLNGANPVALECGTDFNDPGATAINGSGQPVEVVISGTVDIHTPGSYELTYTATQDANSTSTTRTVNVSDSMGPVITIDGPNPMTLSCGQAFTDPGVSASDACEGNRSVSSSGTVNPNTPGTYTITYTSSDSENHTSTATRSVVVEAGGGTAPPTITLIGDPQMTIECGDFTDPGATATVGCGGTVPVTTSGAFDSHTPGTYTIVYSACVELSPGVCDPDRTSHVERVITVQDTTAPSITVNGANPLVVECHSAFTDPGATAHDACAGNFAATATGTVNPNVVGQYTITYSATDPSGLPAPSVTRTVNVVDTTPPTVTAPANVTVYTGAGNTSCNVVVSDATLGTANASDACEGAVSVSRSGVPAGNVFPSGVTTITYSATDGSNNTGTAIQTVTVVDNTNPTITLNGQTPSLWPANHKYKTFQVSDFVTGVSDNCDSTLGVGSVVIAQVTSDETENGNGDGNTNNDIVIAADCKSVQLRAERDGGGNGRVYRITFRVRDASGNTTTVSARVVVPHNPGQTPVEGSPQYTVTSSCP